MPVDRDPVENENPPPSTAERVFLAGILGVLGFFTGVIAVWTFSDLPGVPIGDGAAVPAGIVAGLVCLVLGYRASDRTVEALGELWQILWKLSVGLLSSIRTLIR